MGGPKALLIFVIFCLVLGGLALLSDPNGRAMLTGQSSLTGLLLGDPDSLDASAASLQLQAEERRRLAEQQRQAQREAQARAATQTALAIAAIEDANARATLAAVQQTQAVYLAQTATAWQVTVDAASVQSTATAQMEATFVKHTIEAADRQSTAEAVMLQSFIGQKTADARLTEIAIQKEVVNLKVKETTSYWPFVAGLIAVLFFFWFMKQRDDVNVKETHRHPDGSANPLFAKGRLLNPDASMVPVQDPRNPVQSVDAAQLEITSREQTVKGIRALTRAGLGKVARSAAEKMAGHQQPDPTNGMGETGERPVDVEWSIMDRWPGKKITLGKGIDGNMIAIDPFEDTAPHMLYAGTTGSGKTHYGLHPFIAQALALSISVLILDRTGANYNMFEGHPNARTILIDQPSQATHYLRAAYEEILRRQRMLAQAGLHKWSQWQNKPPAPPVILVVDEFSNLQDDMDSKPQREELLRATRMVAAEGRKAGVYLALAMQDPSAEAFDMRIRRNTSRVAFQVQDAYASQIVLGVNGAEKLLPRHFMVALHGTVIEGVAFDPTNDQIRRFLASRQVAPLPAPGWLQLPAATATPGDLPRQAETTPVPAGAPVPPPPPPSSASPQIRELARVYETLWLRQRAEGKINKSALAALVGKPLAGAMAYMTNEAIRYLEYLHPDSSSTSSTTTENAQNATHTPVVEEEVQHLRTHRPGFEDLPFPEPQPV